MSPPHPALRATLSPQAGRGDTRQVALLPACGEKVAEGRMRGAHALVFLLALVLASAAPASSLRDAGLEYFTDLELTDQDGKRVRLYSDLIAGKTIVVNSFFATCSGSCPVMTGTFRKIQSALGDRIGRDVFLISISVDPETDTPAQLKKFASAAGAKPGWRFLTGDKKTVEQALYKLGLSTTAKESHSSVVIIGNEPKGVWKKAFGLAAGEDVVRLVEEVVKAE